MSFMFEEKITYTEPEHHYNRAMSMYPPPLPRDFTSQPNSSLRPLYRAPRGDKSSSSDASTDVPEEDPDVAVEEIRTKEIYMSQFAKMIDHYGAVRWENLDARAVHREIEVAKQYNVRSVVVRPDCITVARRILEGSDVLVVAVIGFPFTDNETLAGRYNQATWALEDGAHEIDLIICYKNLVVYAWADMYREISNLHSHITKRGGVMNVIFEDRKVTNKQRLDIAEAYRVLGIPCCGHWPGTCQRLEDASGVDRKRVARHVGVIRKGYRGEGQAKAVTCLYDLGDAIFYLATGAHRLGTSETAILMNELDYWCGSQEGPYIYKINAVQYSIEFKRGQ